MRESKFRGKRIDNGEWVYGGFHKHLKVTPSPTGAGKPRENDYAYLIIESGFSDWEMPRPIEAHEVIPETVGEFTGLLDKNGVEVYDDDIYRNLDTNLIGKLTVGIGVGGIYVLCTEYKDGHIYNNLPFAELDTTSFEVIGNIHDNPELLP